MRLAFACVCVCSGCLCAACDSSQPSSNDLGAPSSAFFTAPTPPPGQTFTIFGTVMEGGVPVAGAKVSVLEQAYYVPFTTDASGRYSIRASSAQPWGLSPLMSASRPGYFTDTRFADPNYLPLSRDTQLDFELHPLVYIRVGEVIRSRVGGAVCAHWGYGQGSCSRFAVTVPTSGTLEVTVTAPLRDFDLDIVGPTGGFVFYNSIWSSPSHDRIPAEAGSTYEIRMAGRSPRDFELTTALR